MKTCKAISAIALVALLVVAAAAQTKQSPVQPSGGGTTSGAQPLMVIDSLTHDFGEVNAGTPLRFVFKVKNQGKADLLINSVSPG
jgi:Protein of unknown function (DUF1573)